jgi:VIT1/CCC1 family predicted Fe2+/Mn2+ transporter
MKLIGHIKAGIGFGLTSSIITTIGLMVGLFAGTNSRTVVLGGILTIAIADALSDALAMHIAEESDKGSSEKEVWTLTLSTLFAKFFFAIIFVVPVLFLEIALAVHASIAFGMILIALFSYWIAVSQKKNPVPVVAEHLGIAVVVVLATFFAGEWVSAMLA